MKPKFALKVVVLALAGASLVFGGYWFGTQRNMDAATSGTATEKVDPKTGRKVLYWHDPMVPGNKFDKPGKSPFMDMQLVPVSYTHLTLPTNREE